MKKLGVMLILLSCILVQAQTIPTPNMGLELPIPTVTLGPVWATDLNAAFSLVDSHNHTSGQGVPVPSAGLNINTDLTFQSHNLTTARSLRLLDNLSLINLPADIGAVFEFAGDLWYNNSLGQHVQITQGMGLSLTSAGGFNGDYVGSTASASYSSLSGTFSYTQGVNTPAISDTGPIVVRTTQVNSNGVTITPPNGLASPYQITLLPSLPISTQFLTISSSGQLASTGVVIPAGIISAFGGSTAPPGYIICDGASLLRAGTYADLFAAIGTAYGSVDGTHFNAPDFRGYFQRGWDNGAGHDPDSGSRTASNPGGAVADAVGSFQSDQVGPHTHGVSARINTDTPAGGNVVGAALVRNGTITSDSNGTSETRPANVYVNYIIKY